MVLYTDASRKKHFVTHGDYGSNWAEDLYRYGKLPESKLEKLWSFKSGATDLDKDSNKRKLCEALIKVLVELDLVLEHSGPMDNDSSASSEKYYLVPEVWCQKWESLNRENSRDSLSLPPKYDSRKHMMIGWKVDLDGSLLPSFFRKFVCKIAAALEKKGSDNLWERSRVTLQRGALRWESSPWPDNEKGLALWLERKGRGTVILKVAGMEWDRYLMKDVASHVAKILKEVAKKEYIILEDTRFGYLPLESTSGDLVWCEKEAVKKQINDGERVTKVLLNSGKVDFPLYLFDFEGSSSDAIPNFDNGKMIPRTNRDPEFLVHCHGYKSAATNSPPEFRLAAAKVKRVMAGHWKISSFEWAFSNWKKLMNLKTTKDRVQIMDIDQYQGKENTQPTKPQLLVCLPFRNLYVRSEWYHQKVLDEFCKEALKMFEVLRAKSAEIFVRSTDERYEESRAWFWAPNANLGALQQAGVDVMIISPYKNTGPVPENGPNVGYLLKEETWHYLDELHGTCQTEFHGLDLTEARNSILAMKNSRVDRGEEIGTAKIKLICTTSYELGLTNSTGIAARFAGSSRRQSTLEMEYKVEVYNWNEITRAWE